MPEKRFGPDPHAFNPDPLGDCCDCNLPERNPRHTPPEPPHLPETPYAGTSGWSGSQTSRERAENEDIEGVTSARQRAVLALLSNRYAYGLTWKELARITEWHHGQASGTLSTLHKTKHIKRLSERRDRCQVYVLPEHVDGRETVAQGRAAVNPDVGTEVQYRVVGMTQTAGSSDDGTSDALRYESDVETLIRSRGGRMQTRTIIISPWEDC